MIKEKHWKSNRWHKCKTCGKEFNTCDYYKYAYKRNSDFFCSYNCLSKALKKGETDKFTRYNKL